MPKKGGYPSTLPMTSCAVGTNGASVFVANFGRLGAGNLPKVAKSEK